MAASSVDLIIPVFNEAAVTRDCLNSIIANSDTPFRFIIIDNASSEETGRFLDQFAGSHDNSALIRNEKNLGWVKAVNQGIKASTAQYICIMNNDTIVRTKGWLSKLISVAGMADDIALVNPRFDSKGAPADDKPYIEIDFCRGYCVFIKRPLIEKIGPLDEAYGLGYYDDDDLSMRAIRAGYRCVRAGDVVVEHLKDTTFSAVFREDTRRLLHEENKRLFYSRWGRRLKVVFIATKSMHDEALKGVLLSLARSQHIIYLWNLARKLDVRHTSVREKAISRPFSGLSFALDLYLNRMKKPAKRYDLIFTDDKGIAARLSGMHPAVHYIEIEKDADKASRIAASAAKA